MGTDRTSQRDECNVDCFWLGVCTAKTASVRRCHAHQRQKGGAVLSRLRVMLKSDQIRVEFRTDDKAFTRVRKLPFPYVVTLLVSGWKMSLPNRINRFFHRLGLLAERPTPSAFCRARRKVKPELFRRMNQEMVACLWEDFAPLVRRWKGKLLWAVDATVLNLPDTPETRARYGVQTNQHPRGEAVQGMASFLYDVLNEVTINSVLDRKRSEKSFVLREHRPYFIPQAIVLYDRLYADYAVMALHAKLGTDFVIRARRSHTFREVEEFIRSPKADQVVTLEVTSKQTRWVKELGLPRRVRVRLVKVELKDGTEEILLTSLLDREKYPAADLRGLYEKRWGIETYFDRLKNLLEVERFSSRKVVGIEQDFYGVVFMSTLASVLLKEEEEEAYRSRHRGRKYTYKVNRSVCYTALVDQVVELILDGQKSPEEAEQELKLMLRGMWIPERPGRRNERQTTVSNRLSFHRYRKRIWA